MSGTLATTREHPPGRVARALVRMSRPPQLLLVAGVYALGASIAVARGAQPDAVQFLAGLGAILPTAASIHYANEYADAETDALTRRTPFSGGSGALPETGLPRELALAAAVVSLVVGLGFAVGCLLHGFPLPAVGVLVVGLAFGWQYSVWPLALAWRGLGELDNALLGGVALPTYGYAVLVGSVDLAVIGATLPFAALVFVNLLDTTWPDREADAAVGKDTLATRWTRRRLRLAYLAGVGVWLASLLALSGRLLPRVVVLASLVAAPFVVWGALRYTRTRSPFPTVAAMVSTAVAQLLAWSWVWLG